MKQKKGKIGRPKGSKNREAKPLNPRLIVASRCHDAKYLIYALPDNRVMLACSECGCFVMLRQDSE